VNKPEPATESLRNLVRKAEPATTRKSEDSFVPRYVDLPFRFRNAGARNLQWGTFTLLCALLFLAAGILLRGPRALVPLFIALATFTLLWIAARVRLFQERNGLFLALAWVALLGALVPLLEKGWFFAERELQLATHDNASTAPASAPSGDQDRAEDPPLLTKELGIRAPEPRNGGLVKVLEDSRVLVNGKPYLIKTGELFALDSIKEGQVVFRANELRLSLPEDAVEVTGIASVASASNAGPAAVTAPTSAEKVTRRAQEEAVRRYPALGVKDSAENKLFMETYLDWKNSKSELLDDPEWPLLLADLLAKREGWERKSE
jgi:hypothetical protein